MQAVLTLLTPGAFQDVDYFLHPSNAAELNLVIRNLHLACFWYSAQEMDTVGCLERTRHHLKNNEALVAEGRRALEEAVSHLEAALATPGWEEWMSNGVSIPFEVSPDDLPNIIRGSWSDSMDTYPDMVDVVSLMKLRDWNTPGRTLQDLHLKGWESRAWKHDSYFLELEKVHQRSLREERRQGGGAQAKTKENVKTAAKEPESASKFRKTKVKQLEGLDKNLDEAARNAQAAAVSVWGDELGPRPLPTVLHTKSRSTKVNRVVQSIITSAPDDKFVIFGDVFELGHVTEALDLLDVKSYVHPSCLY